MRSWVINVSLSLVTSFLRKTMFNKNVRFKPTTCSFYSVSALTWEIFSVIVLTLDVAFGVSTYDSIKMWGNVFTYRHNKRVVNYRCGGFGLKNKESRALSIMYETQVILFLSSLDCARHLQSFLDRFTRNSMKDGGVWYIFKKHH
jgi:hypothetical protein